MKLNLSKNKIIKVEGPAFVNVLEGRIYVLGRELTPKDSTVVPRSKVMIFKAVENSILELKLGEGGSFEEFDEILIPSEWKLSAEKILNFNKPIKILVLGDVDCGKSTFCTFLANESFSHGYKTAIIDNDLGQSDIGPPTTIGLGFVNNYITLLSEIPLQDAFFVGSNSPRNFIDRVIIGARKMLDKALKNSCEIIIVNTSGWIAGIGARTLKISLILSLNPNVIVAIQRAGELEHILKPIQNLNMFNIIRMPPIRSIKVRSKSERKLIRESAYMKYLMKSKVRIFSLDKVGLLYSILGSGFPLSKKDLKSFESLLGIPLIYGESSPDSLLLVLSSPIEDEDRISLIDFLKKKTGKETVILLSRGFERGVLAGLYNGEGSFIGLGIIKEINFNRRTIEISTPVRGEIKLIAIGSLKLSGDGKELGKLPPWIL